MRRISTFALLRTAVAVFAITVPTLPAAAQGCQPEWHQGFLGKRAGTMMAFDPVRRQVIAFSGFLEDGELRSDTWAFDGADWRLVDADGPPGRVYGAIATDAARARVVLFGSFDYTDQRTWEWDGTRWAPNTTDHSPSPRGGMQMAYDPARATILAFGGQFDDADPQRHYYDDTWEYDGTDWTQITPADGISPSGRANHTMAYDPLRQRIVLFGGVGLNPAGTTDIYFDDTWEWDDATGTWAQVVTPTMPPPRTLAAMDYDPNIGHVIMQGGYYYTGETWAFDGTDWSIIDSDAPGDRYWHGMVFDQERGRTVLFGGLAIDNLTMFGDTWELSEGAWANVTPTTPSPRTGGSMVYDSARDRTVMFGGSISPGGSGNVCNSETWEWDGLAWTLRSTVGPSPRALAPMAYDSARGRTVMVGGWCGTSVQDTWEWDGNAWALRSTGGPSLRHFAAVAYDAARGKTVLFGGYQPTPAQWMNDTWEWNGSTWKQIAVAGPPARYNHQMAYDATRQRVVLFGGDRDSPTTIFGDTWEYNGTAWTQVSPGVPEDPAPRIGHTMAYDSARERVTLYGGGTFAPSAYFYDTWEFDGAAWTQIAIGSPPARSSAGMAYDAARDQMVLFGGVAPPPVRELNDTWLFTAGIILTSQPADATVLPGDTAQFRVSAAGAGSPTFQWRKDGLPLSDGLSGMGSTIAGANAAVLAIAGVSAADAGAYDCSMDNGCGGILSAAATLTVNPLPPPPCPADFNGDGTVNIPDIFEFLAAWFSGDPRADFNGVGGISVQDIFDFLAAWFAGCP